MRHIHSLFLLTIVFLSVNANAFLISDTYVVEKQIHADTSVGHLFELIPAGYSPATDSITHIKLTYDFTEILSPTNLGDEGEFSEGGYPGEDLLNYENEFAIFTSWIFGWRDVHGDVDTGLTVFETDWTRNNYCQLTVNEVPDDEETQYCAENIDLNGNTGAYFTSTTDNLWLHSIKLEVEVNRVEVPEPNSIFLLGLGLFVIGFLRCRKIHEST